jgi:hypothetical protein
MNLNARILICVAVTAPLLGHSRGAETVVGRREWTDAKVAVTFKRAASDPEALWKLRAAPIDKIFDRLMRVWLDAGDERWSEILVLGPDSNGEWTAEGISARERQSLIARRILNTHDQLDEYVRPKIDQLCEIFRKRLELGKRAGRDEFLAARKESLELLRLALIRRDLVGISIIDSFLHCSDELDPAQNNYVETSPPHWALWTMTERLRNFWEELSPNRFGGQIPDGLARPVPSDLEGARKWWERNSIFVIEFPAPYPIPKWPDDKISAVFERARTSASALSELREAPLKKTFDGLLRLWKEGKISRQRQAEAGLSGPDAQRRWMESEESAGRSHRQIRKLAREAREILEGRLEWEELAVSKLDRSKQLFVTGQVRGKAASRKEFMAAHKEAIEILDFATDQYGNVGYRIIASFLSAPDSIYPTLRGYVKSPPAAWAQAALANRLKQRWDEDIPKDIAGAREWWAQNRERFIGNALQRKPAIPGAKGYSRGVLRAIGSGHAVPPENLTAYIDSVEGVFIGHFGEQTEPEDLAFMVTLEQGKLPQYAFVSGANREIETGLSRLKAPEITDGRVRVVLKAKVAGGWRYAKAPKDDDDEDLLKCGTCDVGDDMQEVAAILFEDLL